MATNLPTKIDKQIAKAGLPRGGSVPFVPTLDQDKKGRPIIKKDIVRHGPKKGKKGYVDSMGRIWIKDYAHAGEPDHWDVQENGGQTYFRVDANGDKLP